MTISAVAAMFGAMFVLALVPGVTVLTVAARSAAYGFVHGVFTTLGIAVGDVLFIVITIFGLSILADAMGDLFVLIKYLGGIYLVWFGIKLWQSKSRLVQAEAARDSALLSSFLTGLFITLGDQKVIIFYFAFLPTFLDLSAVSNVDAAIIILLDIVALGVAKLGYAYMADKSSLLFDNAKNKARVTVVAACVMIGVGVFLIIRA